MRDKRIIQYLEPEILYTFIIVIEEGSFSAAAEVLHKSPSAISYRIKNLEENLGAQLIKRTTHSISLTQAGKYFLEKAKFIISWQDSLLNEIKTIELGVEPFFTIVFNNLLYDSEAAAALLVHLHKHFPSTIFNIKKAVYMGVWDALLHTHANLGFGAPGFHSLDEYFRCQPLGMLHWQLVCSANHPLLQKSNVALKDLEDIPAIDVNEVAQNISQKQSWRLFGQSGMTAPDMEMKIAAHIKGLGIGFIPAKTAEYLIEKKLLSQLEVEGLIRLPSPLSLAFSKSEGKIEQHILNLVKTNDPLIQPFLSKISLAGL